MSSTPQHFNPLVTCIVWAITIGSGVASWWALIRLLQQYEMILSIASFLGITIGLILICELRNSGQSVVTSLSQSTPINRWHASDYNTSHYESDQPKQAKNGI